MRWSHKSIGLMTAASVMCLASDNEAALLMGIGMTSIVAGEKAMEVCHHGIELWVCNSGRGLHIGVTGV